MLLAKLADMSQFRGDRKSFFNWTMNYKRDADVQLRYPITLVPRRNQSEAEAEIQVST
jgi:hypothetical protein